MGRTKGQRHIAEIIKINGINDDGYITETIFNFTEEAYHQEMEAQEHSSNSEFKPDNTPAIA
jgi:DNA-directed RNA polymerase specialized sigma54-like protein